MTSQQFDTTDMVRLEVQESWPDLPNLVPNPRGEGGGWGWPGLGALDGLGDRLRCWPTVNDDDPNGTKCSFGVSWWVHPDRTPSVAGELQIRGAVTRVHFNTQVALVTPPRIFVNFLTPFPGVQHYFPLNADGTVEIPPLDIPPNCLRFAVGVSYELAQADPTAYLEFTDVVVMKGTPSQIAASDPLAEPPWVNVLGSTHQIDTERDELNAGSLTATVYDSTLDPANNTLIRPGKRCRLQALVGGVWENLFTGQLDNPSTVYEIRDPNLPDVKRAKIRLFANDAAAQLANAPRPDGVGTIDELPAVLGGKPPSTTFGTDGYEGVGVPWNVNGSTAAIDPNTVITVSVNESASALDQVAITRDSVLGYAWVDRNGTLQAWDKHLIPTTVAAALDEDDYSDVDLDFDLDRLINTVVVKHVRINPGNGETEEVEFGPYFHDDSVREWRQRRAEFRIQGVNEADIPAYADAILTANAVPAKRINAVTLPLRTVAEVEAKALLDLYDLIELSNTRGGIVADQLRATSVKHSIRATPDGGRWSMQLGFSTEGSVAVPQSTPSPTVGGQRTLAELLRPVGEVTMWYGAKADCPPGWLVMDGTNFDGDVYPKLETFLGGTTLPNMTDRFPIGAGTKALGTFGGNSTKTIAASNLPPHTHTTPAHTHPGINTGGNTLDWENNAFAAGTSAGLKGAGDAAVTVNSGGAGTTGNGGFANTPLDVMNPWRALWFIIRAV